MPYVHDVTRYLETLAPPHLQESYDNAGLITGSPDQPLTGVVFCLDSTEAVVAEAVRLGCNLVVAHHPIVFRGLKRINGANYVERTVIAAIKNDVALYAIHTNLDNVHRNGVNAKIAEKLGLVDTRVLAPKAGFDPSEGVGAGLLGNLPEALSATDFLRLLQHALGAQCVRHTAPPERPVRRVAVCGGAGSFLLPEALRADVDALVTSDFKYHEFFDAEGRLLVADVGHYESERHTIELLFELVREKFPNFALHCTKVNTNPVQYWV